MIHSAMISLACVVLDWSWVALFLVWPVGQLYWFMNDWDARRSTNTP